ncbi:protein kinase domain-containing protein [Hyalangium rubrum]|uniref:Protein kinase n=1 Tax=Hyalangium rubrum TaxID=3103134 RepID=A0ABU5HC06_9BACT|nr:protein kinase [Hyalangium sp. s54d21]MDY7230876.1 protein kinase [Hyalangium sp. s54d21]
MAIQAGAPVDDPDRGRRIGKYQILTRLSVGGMAELFLAFTSGPGGFRKYVALKQILPDVKTDEFVKMFLDEARITAAFSHANIGQVFDLGEEDGELYLAMEFLAGQNIEQLMKAGIKRQDPLPPGFSARVIRDVCLGLNYAHHFVDPTGRAVAVVHRDMSPRNVMVTYDGGVKVIDFGIAKAKGRLGRTAVGMVKGTGGYMSPEQVRGHELDGRTDLFSAGVLLHEMLCNQRLFSAAGDAAMMMQIVEGAIPPPRTLNAQVPEALEAVVMRALTRDRAKRFATGREMAKAIEQAMGEELFDEERMGALMAELFADKRQKTRALLEYANRDDARISEAAGALQDEPVDSVQTAQLRTPSTPSKPPRSAPGSAGHSRPPASGPRPRKPGSDPAQAATPTTPQGGRPRMPARAAEPEEAENVQTTRPYQSRAPRSAPRRPSESVPVVRPSTDRSRTPVETPAAVSRPRTPAETPAAVAKPSEEKSGWAGKLILLAVVAGVGGLLYLEPVRAMFKPGYDSAVKWVKTELDLEPPPPPEQKPWPPQEPPPNPLAAKPPEPTPEPEQPEPTATETPEAVAEPSEPVDLKTPEKLSGTGGSKTGASTPKTGSSKTKPPPVAKAEPGKPGTGTQAPASGKTLEAALAAAPETTLQVDPSGEAEVLDTSSPRAMKKANIGLLTLRTVPSAAVFDGQVKLGTTPLEKVPLTAGTYKLRIIDSEGASRLFSAPVGVAKDNKYTIRVSDLPMYPE